VSGAVFGSTSSNGLLPARNTWRRKRFSWSVAFGGWEKGFVSVIGSTPD
jgi:hypothetical protein